MNMKPDRQQILEGLENDWVKFVQSFQQKSPQAQADYLKLQGYVRFADLLAHVMAWWQEARVDLPKMQADPGYQSPDVDVNAFNARAVEQCQRLSEEEIIASFELLRIALVNLVDNLPAEAWQDVRITGRLEMEVIGHLKEHELV